LWKDLPAAGAAEGKDGNKESQDFKHAWGECHCYGNGTMQISLMPACHRKGGLSDGDASISRSKPPQSKDLFVHQQSNSSPL